MSNSILKIEALQAEGKLLDQEYYDTIDNELKVTEVTKKISRTRISSPIRKYDHTYKSKTDS